MSAARWTRHDADSNVISGLRRRANLNTTLEEKSLLYIQLTSEGV